MATINEQPIENDADRQDLKRKRETEEEENQHAADMAEIFGSDDEEQENEKSTEPPTKKQHIEDENSNPHKSAETTTTTTNIEENNENNEEKNDNNNNNESSNEITNENSNQGNEVTTKSSEDITIEKKQDVKPATPPKPRPKVQMLAAPKVSKFSQNFLTNRAHDQAEVKYDGVLEAEKAPESSSVQDNRYRDYGGPKRPVPERPQQPIAKSPPPKIGLSYELILKKENERVERKRALTSQQVTQQQQPQQSKALLPGMKLAPSNPSLLTNPNSNNTTTTTTTSTATESLTSKIKSSRAAAAAKEKDLQLDSVLSKIPKELSALTDPSSIPQNLAEEDAQRDSYKNLVSDGVMKRLTKYYKQQKMTKDDFKFYSRKLTHKILEDSSFSMSTITTEKIGKYVDKYVEKKGGNLSVSGTAAQKKDKHSKSKK